MAQGAGRGINKAALGNYESATNKQSINTTAERNHCGRLSFKGSVPKTLPENIAKGLKEIIEGLVGTEPTANITAEIQQKVTALIANKSQKQIKNDGLVRVMLDEIKIIIKQASKDVEIEEKSAKKLKDTIVNIIKEELKTTVGTGEIAKKIAGWKITTSILTLFNDQSLVAEALYALGVTAGLRAMVHLATPSKDESEKTKNQYRAANAVATGVIGTIFTILFAKPVGGAVDKILGTRKGDISKVSAEIMTKVKAMLTEKHPEVSELAETLANDVQDLVKTKNARLYRISEKIGSQIQELLKTDEKYKNLPEIPKEVIADIKQIVESVEKELPFEYFKDESYLLARSNLLGFTKDETRTFKELATRVHQPVFMPVRAWMTIAIVPPLLALMGLKKSSSKPKQQETGTNNLLLSKVPPTVFKSFAGGIVDEN